MKMKTTKIKVDFFKVKVEGSYSSLESLIGYINGLPDDENKSLKVGEYSVIRLLKATKSDDFYQGDIVRIKMDDIPAKASSKSSKTEVISLNDDEGIGTSSAFLYHIPSSILLLQRNNHGIDSKIFSRYFQEKTPPQSVLILESIVHSDLLKRLYNMKEIKSFDFRFAQLDKKEINASENNAVEKTIDLNKYFDAPTVEIKMSSGRGKAKTLNKNSVTEAFKSFFRIKNNPDTANVVSARIIGADEDNRTEIINLLECTIREDIAVKYPGRSISYQDRKDALTKAWVNRLSELTKMYNGLKHT
jgi:hypothetical protein